MITLTNIFRVNIIFVNLQIDMQAIWTCLYSKFNQWKRQKLQASTKKLFL